MNLIDAKEVFDFNTCRTIITTLNGHTDEMEFIANEISYEAYMYCLWRALDEIEHSHHAAAKVWLRIIYDRKLGHLVVTSDKREKAYEIMMTIRDILINRKYANEKQFPINKEEQKLWGKKQ